MGACCSEFERLDNKVKVVMPLRCEDRRHKSYQFTYSSLVLGKSRVLPCSRSGATPVSIRT